MQQNQQLVDVLRTLFRWKRFIIGVCLITGIGSILISLMLDNYYQSYALFYATNHDLAKPNPIGSNVNFRQYYGGGDDIDRIMTLAESERLANFLIDSFDLFEHYGIDPNDEKSKLQIIETYKSQFKVVKTRYDAIQILVEDTDPELAMKIANTAMVKVNGMAQEMIRQSQKQQMEMMRENIASREKTLKSIEDTLLSVRQQYGIFNTATQSRDLPELLLVTEGKLRVEQGRLEELKKHASVPRDTIIFVTARVKGLQNDVNALQRQRNEFARGFADSEVFYRLHQVQKEEIAFEYQRLQQLEAAYNSDFTAIQVVEYADWPRDKSRPKRMIIVAIAVLLAFILSCLAALLTEAYKGINWREVVDG